MANCKVNQLKAPVTFCCIPAKVMFALIQLGFCVSWAYFFFTLEGQLHFKLGYLAFILVSAMAFFFDVAGVMLMHMLAVNLALYKPLCDAYSHLVLFISCAHRGEICPVHFDFYEEHSTSICIRYFIVFIGLVYYTILCFSLIKHAIMKNHYQNIKQNDDSTYTNEKSDYLPIYPNVV